MASTSALPHPSRPATKLSAPSDTSRVPSPQPSKLRAPASPRPLLGGSIHTNSTSNLATLRSASTGQTPGSPDKTLRRTISIASFPQPPKPGNRLSTASTISGISSTKGSPSDLVNPATPTGSLRSKKQSRLSNGTLSSYRSSKTPSLLNGSGDGISIPNGPGTRDSEGQFSIPSPTHSRSSSAQGSYSTSATTFDDADDAAGNSKGGSKAKESKGNVIVSVRVRPDNAGGDSSKTEGEWMVDGRRSLISYRGKESGDYYYGKSRLVRKKN